MIKKQNDKRKIAIKYKLEEYIDKIYIRAEFKIMSEITVNKSFSSLFAQLRASTVSSSTQN